MSKKANPATIGLFVVVATAIAIAGLLILGSGQIFKRTDPYVVFFDRSLAGLDVGAPVEFRGVRVGSVKQIMLVYNRESSSVASPVYIELERGRMTYTGDEAFAKGLVYHIQQGLRAQLQSQSFVTGKLKIMLVESPDSPIILTGGDPTVQEIPAIPGLLDSLAERLEDLPLERIVTNLNTTAEALAQLAESGKLGEIVDNLQTGTEGLAAITTSEQLGVILDQLQIVAQTVGDMAKSGRLQDIADELHASLKAIADIAGSGSIADMADDLNQALSTLNATLLEGGKLIIRMNEGVTPLRHETSNAMTEILEAARATRNLMEYLDRHPESLIQGKGTQ